MRVGFAFTLVAITLGSGLGSAALRPAIAQDILCAAIVNGSGTLANSLPQTNGPVPVTGGVGSTGTVFAACDAGHFRGFGSVSNPVSGLFTPQITAEARDLLDVYDVTFSGVPDSLVGTPCTVVLHTRLTGQMRIEGAHPYAAGVEISFFTLASEPQYGSAHLDMNGFSRSGLLAGVSAGPQEFPVDLSFTTYLVNGPADGLFFHFLVTAGGTALGTDVNGATCDFAGAGWHFATTGPVLEGLPAGVRVDIPSLRVVDNQWLGGYLADVAPVAPAHGSLALSVARNPARGRAELSLAMPADGPVRVDVFDVRGRRVITLLDGAFVAGSRSIAWDARGVDPGVYFVRASSGRESATARLVLLP